MLYTKEQIEQIVIEKVKTVLGEFFTDEVTSSNELGDLGLDSLDRVEVIMKLESELDISIPDDWEENMTIEGIVEYVSNLIDAKSV